MLEAISALGFGEAIDEIASDAPDRFDGSCRGTLQEPIERRKDEFDRVNVGAVRRQVDEPCSGSPDRFTAADDLARVRRCTLSSDGQPTAAYMPSLSATDGQLVLPRREVVVNPPQRTRRGLCAGPPQDVGSIEQIRSVQPTH